MKLQIVMLSLLIVLISSAYSEQKSKLFANLSVITHCTKQQVESWSCKPCKAYPNLVDVSLIEYAQTHIVGFIGYDKSTKNIVISWRGTVDAKNWAEDLDFKMTNYPGCSGCKIHEGFYLAYLSVAPKINDKIISLLSKYSVNHFDVTGHSLGGALALITGMELLKKYPRNLTELYNYGCPRVGNGALATYIKSKIASLYRVIHYKDIVPHLPPFDLDYTHAPYEVLYDEQMVNAKLCDSSGQDKACSDQFAPNYSFADHTFYWLKTDSSVC